MKYDVHVYIVGRIKMEGVEAGSQKEACQIADGELHTVLNGEDLRMALVPIWDSEETVSFLVDEQDDEDFSKSRSYTTEEAYDD
jgi:hypothetical protein